MHQSLQHGLLHHFLGVRIVLEDGIADEAQALLVRMDKFREKLDLSRLHALDEGFLNVRGRPIVILCHRRTSVG